MAPPRASPSPPSGPSACSTTPRPPPGRTTPSISSSASSNRCPQVAAPAGECYAERAFAMRTIHFVSLGCVKNRVDTEVMLGVATGGGWKIVDEPDEAEVIVVNTCGFIGEAKKESIDTIFELAEYKKVGACKKLVVTGCLSQRYSGDLAKQMPEVDHFIGSSDMLKLGPILEGDAHRMRVGTPADWVIRASDPRVVTASRASAWLKIAEG